MNYLFSLKTGPGKESYHWKSIIDRKYPCLDKKIPLLTIACQKGHAEIVTLLLSKNAHSNPTYVIEGSKKTVELIIRKVDPKSPANHPVRIKTPLTEALFNGHFDIAKTLYPPPCKKIKINTQAVMRELLISLLEHEDVEKMKSVLNKASELLNQPVDINFNYKTTPFIQLILKKLEQYAIHKNRDPEGLIDIIEYLFELGDAELDNQSLHHCLGPQFKIALLNLGVHLNHPRLMNIVLTRLSQTELAKIKIGYTEPGGSVGSPIYLRPSAPHLDFNSLSSIPSLEAANCLILAGVPYTLSFYKKVTQTAIEKKNVNILASLIMNNLYSDPQMSLCWGDITQIFLASGNLNEQNPMVLTRLMEMGADLSNHVDTGQLLLQALEEGKSEIARTIISHGNYEFRSKSVIEALLTLVVEKEYGDIALLLLQNKRNQGLVISFTPLINQFVIAAIKQDNRDLLSALFELPAFRNHKTQLDKKHFFESALQYNRLGLLHYLFNRLTSPDSGYYPPLAVIKASILKSIEVGNAELLTLILSCCPNALPALVNEEFSILPSRDSKTNLKIAHILLENNMMLDKKTRQDLPWLAVEANDIELIRLLVRKKQNSWSLHHDFNEEGETLHSLACKFGHVQLASLLVEVEDNGVTHSPAHMSTNRYGFLKRKECEEDKKPVEEIYKTARAKIT